MRKRKYNISKEFLVQKYIVQNLCISAIAKELGCDSTVINKRLKEYNIPINSSRKRQDKIFNISKDFLVQKYSVEKLNFKQIAKIVGCGKTTIEQRMIEYHIPRRKLSEIRTFSNPMFNPETRKKVSEWRKTKMPQEMKDKYAAGSRRAWKEGKYDGSAVGKCKWFSYEKKDGTTIKCQGTWELAFAKWADEKNLKFDCHKKWIPYIAEDGVQHNYYPDFFVYDWNCYVDVKNKYHYSLNENKFNLIKKSNPGMEIKILFKKDMLELGVLL